jgi:octaprenyl-diphosphate synthase
MLRSSLAARLWQARPRCEEEVLVACCAATELVHTATLLHDDVLDGGLRRRGEPTLWVQVGRPTAVLAGDMLLCEGISLVAGADGGRYTESFVRMVSDTCRAEIEQDVRSSRQLDVDEASCLRLACGKSGPLFAFPASVVGGEDAVLSARLAQVGLCVGTMYQLMDDLLDASGAEIASGKTLGCDELLGRPTLVRLAASGGDGTAGTSARAAVRHHVERLRRQICQLLEPCPELLAAAGDFLDLDVGAGPSPAS